MEVDTAEVVLEVPVAVEPEGLDTAGAWFQFAEQMKCSRDPVVKLALREPVQVQQAGLMVPVSEVNYLDTAMEVGFEASEVEAAHLEQEVLVVGKGSGLDVAAEWLPVVEPLAAAVSLPVQPCYFPITGSRFWVSGALQDGAVFQQFPACRAKSAHLLGPPTACSQVASVFRQCYHYSCRLLTSAHQQSFQDGVFYPPAAKALSLHLPMHATGYQNTSSWFYQYQP